MPLFRATGNPGACARDRDSDHPGRRHCYKRFWGRRRLFRLGTALARPLIWPGIFQMAFGSLYLAQKTLPAIRRRLSSGTLDKRNS